MGTPQIMYGPEREDKDKKETIEEKDMRFRKMLLNDPEAMSLLNLIGQLNLYQN